MYVTWTQTCLWKQELPVVQQYSRVSGSLYWVIHCNRCSEEGYLGFMTFSHLFMMCFPKYEACGEYFLVQCVWTLQTGKNCRGSICHFI